jgi:hypothetical protein
VIPQLIVEVNIKESKEKSEKSGQVIKGPTASLAAQA